MANVVKQIGEQMEKLGLSVGGGRTRSGRKYGLPSLSKKVRNQRRNKDVKRGSRTGKTRSGRRFRGVVRNVNKSMKRVMKSLTPKKDSKKLRKQRSNKGVKRGARTGKTRSGRRFRPRA
jgi:hypothetical protein